MERRAISAEEFAEIETILSQEVRFGIIIGLEYFPSMNLRQLSKFVGKTEPTTYTHVDKLLKEELIEIDPDNPQRGKFYKLTPKAKQAVARADAVFDVSQESSTAPELRLDVAIKTINSVATVAKNVTNFFTTFIEENKDKILKQLATGGSEGEESISASITLNDVKIYTHEQRRQLQKIISEFVAKVDTLENANQTGEPIGRHFVYLFSAPIDRLNLPE